MGEIREPVKKQAVEKKNKITQKGFELMCEKGYYNVSCIDIAKYAGVSTGIIYQYFTDKKDIFIAGVKEYSNSIMFPMLNVLESKPIKKENFSELINAMIDNFIKVHKMSKKAHEQLMAMAHLDEDVAKIFAESELETTEKIVEMLKKSGFIEDSLEEKVHIVYGMIDNFCHEVVYHKHKNFDYDKMKNEVVSIIVNVIK